MSSIERNRVVVVGGGLGGLSMAAYLARAGHSVHVLERSTAIGGRAATAHRDGFFMNRGPHAVYRNGEAVEVLAELEVPLSGNVPSLDGFALGRGSLHRLPVNSVSLLSTTLFGLGAKAAASAWLARVPRIDASELAGKSVSAWLDETGVRTDVRSLIEAFLRLSAYANAPELFSAETAVRQVQKALGSVLYVDGGWQTLVDGLAATARRSSARIETGERVSALARDRDGSYSVRLADGRSLPADLVVLAAGPREAAKLLESAGAAPPSGMTDAIPVKMATLDLALSKLPRPKHRFVLGVDQPLYLSVHSAAAKLAPPGGALLHVAKYLTGDEADPERDRREIEALLDLAQPGWRDAVVHAEFLPRMVVAERLDLAVEQGRRGRPAPELPKLPGVYLVGDWVQGGSWLADAALGSARTVAHAILGRAEARKAVA